MVFGGSQLRESCASFANPARASEASIPNGFLGGGSAGSDFCFSQQRSFLLSEPSIPNAFWGRWIREAAAGLQHQVFPMFFGGSQLRESSASLANPARASRIQRELQKQVFLMVIGVSAGSDFCFSQQKSFLLSEPSIPNAFWGRGIREVRAGFAKLPQGSNTKYS